MTLLSAYKLGRVTASSLEAEAHAVLSGDGPLPAVEYVKQRQDEARYLGFDHALALWSRLHFRWLKIMGRLEVHDELVGRPEWRPNEPAKGSP